MLIDTRAVKLKKALAANSDATAFSNPAASLAEPSGASVTDVVGEPGVSAPNRLVVIPFGTDAENETFDMRVFGYDSSGTSVGLWVPLLLCDVTCTLGAAAGVGSGLVTDSELFADTITVNTGNEDVDVWAVSNAEDMVAHFVVDLKGCRKVAWAFDMTGAASGNALYKFV